MTFNSLHFILFFLVVLATTAALRDRVGPRNRFLLLASWYFYGVWDVRFLLLLIGSGVVDYWLGRGIGAIDPANTRGRKLFVAASVTLNLTVLGFFKYFNFFADSTVTLLDNLGFHAPPVALEVVLPVGISFYTFQSMSYIIDVYRGHLKAERHYLDFALFVSFFPQLVAGPIERATHLLPQMKAPSVITWDDLCGGTWLIAVGLFKKVVLADNVARVTNAVFDTPIPPDRLSALMGVYAFAIQIFCDFSAYSDIARGAARCMGFDLMRNFDLPYFAVNPSDFWRRWHISLSTWLRDYLYIPLGGNRRGSIVTYRNLMLTMLIGGLWHGAAWTFVLWGLFHGAMLCLHRLLSPMIARVIDPRGVGGAIAWALTRALLFFQLTCFGWLLFRAQTMQNLGRMIDGLLGRVPGERLVDDRLVWTLVACALPVIVGQLVIAAARDYNVIFRLPVVVRALVYAGMMLAFVIYGEFGGGEFIYFQF